MSLDFLNAQIFKAIPLPCLLLMPNAPYFTIMGVNLSYLTATNSKESDLIGRNLFDAFPDNPKDLIADGESHLMQSLLTVVSTRKIHPMQTQKYDIPIRGTDNFEIRYWQPENVPVLDDEGRVSLIIHTVLDVT